MSESLPPFNRFLDNYSMPVDQLAYEMDLRERYAQQFPDAQPLLNAVLNDVQRVAGIDIPQYQVSEEDREASDAAGLNDELGFLNAPFGPTSSATLYLELPVEHTPEEIAAMSDRERHIAEVTAAGTVVVGDLPAGTRSMLEGVYSLTGASVARDGRLDGESRGHVIRRGEYQGTPIYFVEQYDDASPFEGQSTLSLRLVGSTLAEKMIHEPSQAERQEFIALSGISRFDANKFIYQNDVTRENYRQIADAIRQARDTIEGDG